MDTPQAKRARTAGVDALSVTEMKSLIKSAGLSSKDCLEKSDLRKRSREALARLDETRPSKARRASDSPAPAAAASNDVDAMSVKELKALIGRAGLSCIDCAEKSELRARAREALARLDEARRLESQRGSRASHRTAHLAVPRGRGRVRMPARRFGSSCATT